MEEEIWGKLETKVRRLVFDLLEPSINRVAEHKEIIENLRRTDESLGKKINNLEIVTEKLTKKLSLVDDFSRKIMQFDSVIKLQETTFIHDREAMKDQLESFLKQLTNAEENIAILQGQTQNQRTDLVNLSFETNNSKQQLSNRVENVREEMIQMIFVLNSKSIELNNYFAVLDKKFINFQTDFDEIDIISKKAEHYGEDNMNQLKLIFKNFAGFKKEAKEQIDKVRQMSIQFSQTLTDQMKNLRERVKADTPILTQLQISDNLHTVLDLSNKKLLAEYEKMKYAEWELNVIPSFIEDKIYSARKRTQEAIDKPLPKPEIIQQVQPIKNEVEKHEFARQDASYKKRGNKAPVNEEKKNIEKANADEENKVFETQIIINDKPDKEIIKENNKEEENIKTKQEEPKQATNIEKQKIEEIEQISLENSFEENE